jgi:hypothetical protein
MTKAQRLAARAMGLCRRDLCGRRCFDDCWEQFCDILQEFTALAVSTLENRDACLRNWRYMPPPVLAAVRETPLPLGAEPGQVRMF